MVYHKGVFLVGNATRWHDVFLCAKCLIHICGMSHYNLCVQCVMCDVAAQVRLTQAHSRIHAFTLRDMTQFYVRHASFSYVVCLIIIYLYDVYVWCYSSSQTHSSAFTHSCVWHDWFVCDTCLIHFPDVPHNNSFMCVMCVITTYSYVWCVCGVAAQVMSMQFSMYLCMYVCVYVCMSACMYVCLSFCSYVCMYVCME